ncbi:Arrestin domain protein [Taphrina deformans PYCC 5710]|uniref:Arrestin domain protein n=1 Tax=Taphrina deformans (strain PYCC 5710 / ATCC 11124 / CBS 356.35 / IMI 108563 / JCM 9778 / NBRC 8474) TaxID=1097556 RepID=R4X751_TAPDE|nr:Arrestin domain protein [Taphrina deformans PYCC 5710]|eukprot:CCG81086.1 Arrestin domain protein [Taphrina deformans PYCC 5710]
MVDSSYVPPLTTQNRLATTGGGTTSLSISLAEPVLFLTGGFDSNVPQGERPTMLRGTLMVKLAKPSKLKAVSLQFCGKSRTEWPEGIPPKKQEFWEEKELMNHTWTFFNAQFPIHEHSHGADQFTSSDANVPSTQGNDIAPPGGSPSRSSTTLDRSSSNTIGLPFTSSRSFSKHDNATTQMKGYKVFAAGEYLYNFELPIPSFLPESIQCDMGKVAYELNATVDRAGAFKSNLAGAMAVELIRTPGEANLESSEPIAISRNWEDQLHYDIVISGKSFPLGQKIPIAFKLTPLAKVRVHRIKIFITETVEYWCKNKKVHRLEPTRKILLMEKNAGVSGGANESLLGNIDGASNAGATEFDLEVKLPGCSAIGKDKIHFDTTFTNIKVHHWIKIIMRLSKADPQPNDPNKRRHFEISIDSPVHLLSCRCTNANTQLPTYGDSSLAVNARLPCPCGNTTGEVSTFNAGTANVSSSNSPSMPQGAFGAPDTGSARPMHLLRQPSTLPPPFSADIAPPPLMTPPPGYDYTPGQQRRMLDYFTQLTVDDGNENERAADDMDVGRRTPGLHPALGGGLAVPGQGLHDPRGRRGSAIELSSSSRFGDSGASFYSRDVPSMPSRAAGGLTAPLPTMNFRPRPSINGSSAPVNRTSSSIDGISGGLVSNPAMVGPSSLRTPVARQAD